MSKTKNYNKKTNFVISCFIRIIIRKIDKDNDEKITEYELKSWIEYVASKSKQNSTDRQWNDINPTNQSSIKWTEYLIKTYGPEEGKL